MTLKFNIHNVTNTETKEKARVHYSLDNHVSGKPCVTLYEKDYNRNLQKLFRSAINNSDSMTDYFENTRVRFFEGDTWYHEARDAAERAKKSQEARWQKKMARL